MVLGVKMKKAESLFTPATGNEEQIFKGFLVARSGGKTIGVFKTEFDRREKRKWLFTQVIGFVPVCALHIHYASLNTLFDVQKC